jgi:hypothetical protein
VRTPILLLLLASITLWAWNPRVAQVRQIVGKAVIDVPESEAEKPVKVGMPLRAGDIIITDKSSSVQMLFPDGTSLNVQENSAVQLIESSQDNKGGTRTLVEVQVGKLKFKVKKLKGDSSYFRFRTPTATAAIRGTEGGIETSGQNSLAYLNEGRLEFASIYGDAKQEIKANEMAIQKAMQLEQRKINQLGSDLETDLRKAREELYKPENISLPKEQLEAQEKQLKEIMNREPKLLSPSEKRLLRKLQRAQKLQESLSKGLMEDERKIKRIKTPKIELPKF